jgi:hypothetical protein
MISNFQDERFGKCFDRTCDALFYPQEVKNIISDEIYTKYKKLFNTKMANKGGKRKSRKIKNHMKKITRKIKKFNANR